MTCEEAVEAMPFYHYGELSAEQEEQVEAHCADCELCSRELESYRGFARSLDRAELEPSPALLAQCREMLAVRVEQWQIPAASGPWWQQPMRTLFASNLRLPLAAAALLCIGWFCARLESKLAVPALQPAMVSLVRSVEPDASGRVTIAVDDVQRRMVSGGLNDPAVRRLVMAAARDESNAGVRVESVGALCQVASSGEVRAALLDAIVHDPSPGVRCKALEGLKQFSADAQVRKVLSGVLLSDANPGVRMQVIDLLIANRDDSMVGLLQNQVRKEDNGYVRVRLQKVLAEMNASPGTF